MNRVYYILIPVLVVLCIAGGLVLAVVSYMGDSSRQLPLEFFSEKENSMDGIVFGTSSIYRYWIPTEAYEKHGTVIGSYASAGLPLVSLKYMIETALENQTPEFIAIEIRCVTKDLIDLQNRETSHITDVTDHMPATITRLKYINAVLEFDKELDTHISDDPRKFRYPVSEEAVEKAMKYCECYSEYKGFPVTGSSFSKTKFKSPADWTDKIGSVPYEERKYLDELFDYCETLDCDVIFFSSPCALKYDRQSMVNKALDMAEGRGFRTKNFNANNGMKKMNISENDFYNDRHTNVYGAIKFTEYMYQYLNGIYDLEDHRGDSDYKSWDEAAESLRYNLRSTDPDISFDVNFN